MKERLLRLAIIAALALALPAAAAADPGHGQQVKAEKQHQGDKANKPDTTGDEDKDTDTENEKDKPESAGDRPHNHGWFVSQVAKDSTKVATNTQGESTHGAAVSAVAKSDQGK
jgi:hypothetical protein